MTHLVPAALAFVITLAFAHDAAARAYYAPLNRVEDRVEAVAIIETVGIADVDIEGEHWSYHQLVQADVVDVVAGALPHRIEILGDRDFACAPVAWGYRTRYLAMIERVGDRWTATNNEWGRLEIVDGEIDWPYHDSQETVPVDEIVALLESRLEARLGRGRFTEPDVSEAVATAVVATGPAPGDGAPTDERWVAPWILLGGVAVASGFVAATRRRRATAGRG